MKKTLLVLLLVLSSSLFTLCEAQYTVLHNFKDTDGANPRLTNLTLSGNILYGMTYQGGADDSGCIFSIHTDGTGYTVIHNFNDASGKSPYGSLTLSGNVLYGMTSAGGKNSDGVIFSINANGSGYTDIHDFNDTSGKSPYGSLTLSGNMLYGMASAGGKNSDGVIFSINTNGSGYTDIHDFNDTNGKSPYGSLTLSGNVLYGMASSGGTNSCGLIFSTNTNGGGFTVLYNFHGVQDGLTPWGSLILSGGVLYGMTYGGGVSYVGNIFSINTNGTGYLNLLEFTGTIGTNRGKYPFGDLTLSASGNVLYGMTSSGDVDGNIFSVNTNGTGYTDLMDFDSINGFHPMGSLTPSVTKDTLFGMTGAGGNAYGTIFSFKDTNGSLGVNNIAPTFTSIHVYPNPSNGQFTLVIANPPGRTKQSPNGIEVYNTSGQKVFTETLRSPQANDNTIDLSNQPDGVYLYRVITNSGELIGEGKVVIER